MLEGYEDVARLHLSFSGTLLKQLEDPGVRETFHDVVNIEDFLARYRRANIEYLGSGLYHSVYPLIPPADWDAQTAWWLGLGRHLLGREQFAGFWPPEMGFCMEMIPAGTSWLSLCDRGLLVHQTQTPDALGGIALSAVSGPL